ncbi:MAG: hypothetical protein WBP26_05075, partial [Candidatus Saccharimonadales bacterium]
ASGGVTSVNSHTGVVTLTKSDIGLDNVDNTSDATKNAASATLVNKTISGASNTLSNIPQGAVTGLVGDLADKTVTSRQILSGTGLTGGGDLTADRTLSVSYGTTAGTAAQGNDSRLSDARTPTVHKTSHAPGGADAIDYTFVHLVGTFAAMPIAAASNNGLLYLATDANGGTLYRSNGSVWAQAAPGVALPGGYELAYAEVALDVPFAGNGTTNVVGIAGASVTFTAPGTALYIHASGQGARSSAGGTTGNFVMKIWDGAVGSGTLLGAMVQACNDAYVFPKFELEVHRTLGAGSHTINVSMESSNAALTGTMYGAIFAPFSVSVRKA